jgi:hypothetical protein
MTDFSPHTNPPAFGPGLPYRHLLPPVRHERTGDERIRWELSTPVPGQPRCGLTTEPTADRAYLTFVYVPTEPLAGGLDALSIRRHATREEAHRRVIGLLRGFAGRQARASRPPARRVGPDAGFVGRRARGGASGDVRARRGP